MVRTSVLVACLVIGTILVVFANLVVWANRTVFDTDVFVATTSNVMAQPEVQDQVSVRLTDAIMVQGDIEARLSEQLPDGLQFLAAPLTEAVRNIVLRTMTRIVSSEAVLGALEAALTVTHGSFMAILEDRSERLRVEGEQLILDLNAVLQTALETLGLEYPEGLFDRLDLPEDAGQIVLVEDFSSGPVYRAVRAHNAIALSVVLAAVAFLAAAILLSTRRLATARTACILIAVAGAVTAITLVPARAIVGGLAKDTSVGKLVFDELVHGYRVQSWLLLGAGILAAIGLHLWQNRELRHRLKDNITADDGVTSSVGLRARVTWLRVGVILVGAILILGWPDPSTRVYVTLLVLLVAALVLIEVLSSDAEWARTARRHISPPQRATGRDDAMTERRSSLFWGLRFAGVAIALVGVVVWPSLTVGGVILAAALLAVYLGGLELLDRYYNGKGRETPPDLPAARVAQQHSSGQGVIHEPAPKGPR